MKQTLIIGTFLLLILTGCVENGVVVNEVSQRIVETSIPDTTHDVELEREYIPINNPTQITSTTTISSEELEVEQSIEDEVEFYLSDDERWIVECMVMGGSGYEDYTGQILVAQCILNACLNDNLQPSEVRIVYKYAGWKEDVNDSVKDAVKAVFDDGYKYTDEFILWFYSPKYSEGKFHNTQRFVLEHGGQRFYAPLD